MTMRRMVKQLKNSFCEEILKTLGWKKSVVLSVKKCKISFICDKT